MHRPVRAYLELTAAMATLLAVLGVLAFLPFTLIETADFAWAGVTFGAWATLGCYGIGVTVLACFLWCRGVARVPASTAVGFMGVLPISAVLLSYAGLGESFARSHAIGVARVLSGIALITRAAPAPRPS